LFYRYGKKEKSSSNKSLKDLTRIIAAPVLLAEEKRSVLMLHLRNLCALEEVRFDELCLSLVVNLVDHCQGLPETSTSFYSQQGGLLDYALNRTEAALELFQQYLIQENGAGLSEEQKLWQYALFSAGILQGMGKLQINYTIKIYDSEGQFLKQWNPLLENLVSVGHYYSYELQHDSDEEFHRRLNLLIARLLMPQSGFNWIASNPQVLAVWLALLNEDPYEARTLGTILDRGKGLAFQRYFDEMSKPYSSRGSRYGKTFAGGGGKSIAEIEQLIGVEFVQWLRKYLLDHSIMINKAPLFMVPGGLLISVELFKSFAREHHPEYKNWQVVQKGFLSLGLHRLGPDKTVNSRFEQSSNQQMYSGIVLADYAAVLPEECMLHNLHTGKDVIISAIELIHQAQYLSSYFTSQQVLHTSNPLPHLAASGQWKAENVAPAKLAQRPPGALKSRGA
jgi:integrating conjugative element relaxase (TIGR03760 family)